MRSCVRTGMPAPRRHLIDPQLSNRAQRAMHKVQVKGTQLTTNTFVRPVRRNAAARMPPTTTGGRRVRERARERGAAASPPPRGRGMVAAAAAPSSLP
jgi:hypothetical protein